MIHVLTLMIFFSTDPKIIRTPVDLQSQIAVRNGQMGTLSWHCEYQNGTLENGRFIPGKEFSKSDVITEPSSGRCRLHVQSVKRGNADIPFYGERRILAFDGQQARYYLRQSTTGSIPLAQPSDGIEDSSRPHVSAIRPEINPANLDGDRCGLAFVLGNTFNGALDYVLKKAKSERGATCGIEQLELGHVYRLRIEDEKTYSLYDYDIDKQCFVNFELHMKGSEKTLIRKSDIELAQIDNVWLPTRVITRTPYDKFAQQLIYSDWKVNEPIPDARFTFSFPTGARVEDHVEKKIYIVGRSPVDEAKAIRDYMASFQIKQPAPSWMNWKWLIGLGGMFLIAASLLLGKRFRRGFAFLLLVAATTPASADEPGNVHRLECGFQVTVAVLEYHTIKYDPAAVSQKLMADSRGGISLAKVKDLLDSYGLETSARNQLGRDDAKRAVESGWLAIVPAEAKTTCGRLESGPTSGKPNHYFLLWNSPTEGVMVIDVLRRPVPLAKSDLTDRTFRNQDSATLFIRRRS